MAPAPSPADFSTVPKDLPPRLLEAAARLFDPTPIVLAYAFGSRVQGNPRPDSDLDVGYYLSGFPRASPLPLQEEMLLAARLSGELGLPVDLRNLGEAPLELRGRALEEGMRIYSGDEVARVNIERDLLGRYHDYKEEIRQLHEERLRRFAETGL
jgi:predicted nucleotidyltransferase